MRQILSSGSVKAIWLNKEEVLKILKQASEEAMKKFPEIKEIRLFCSLAKKEETGLSDVDILIIADTKESNPIERIKPYFFFFSEIIKISIDLLVVRQEELENFGLILKESIPIVTRDMKI